MITIVIVLNTLHNYFDTTISSLLEIRDKTIDQIESILQLKKVQNLSKRSIRTISKFAMTFMYNKYKANSDKKCLTAISWVTLDKTATCVVDNIS